jgi:hypothetical protein
VGFHASSHALLSQHCYFVHSMNPMTPCLAHGWELGVGQGKEQIMGHLGRKKQICFQSLECGRVALGGNVGRNCWV